MVWSQFLLTEPAYSAEVEHGCEPVNRQKGVRLVKDDCSVPLIGHSASVFWMRGAPSSYEPVVLRSNSIF